jgi:hypothetical protein
MMIWRERELRSRAAIEEPRSGRPFVGALGLLLMLTVAIVSLSGCSLTGDEAVEGKLGESASNTRVEVTVHSVKILGEITMEDGSVSTVRHGGVYAVVDMTVRNLQDSTCSIDLDDLYIRMGDEYYSSDEALSEDSQAPAEFVPLRTGHLRAGKKRRGMVVFMLPRGTLDSITYRAQPEDIVVGLAGMKASPPRQKPAPRIGRTAKAGGLALTIHSITYHTLLTYVKPGSSIISTLQPKKGNRLAVVALTVKNLSRKPVYRVDPLAIELVDSKGTSWVAFDRTTNVLAESAQFPVKSLKPGAKASGKVVISVPANGRIKTVRCAAGVLGPPLESSTPK